MIKFFRKIRQNLLMENKTGKYFKYAIGEIILVVIGILIALQINNWNENRKLNEIRRSYYHQIEKDLDSEIQNLNSRIIGLEKSINSYEVYTEYTKTSGLQLFEIIEALFKVDPSWSYLSFYSNTIETLESTGDIKIIPLFLRTKLIELKRRQEASITVASGNDNVYLINIAKASDLGYSRALKHPNKEINQKIKQNYLEIILILESSFGLKNITENDKISSFKLMLEEVIELKDLIGQELEK